MAVTERGPGGIAQEIQIQGSSGTAQIRTQSQIRSQLGDASLVFTETTALTLRKRHAAKRLYFHSHGEIRGRLHCISHLRGRLRPWSRDEPERSPGNGEGGKELPGDPRFLLPGSAGDGKRRGKFIKRKAFGPAFREPLAPLEAGFHFFCSGSSWKSRCEPSEGLPRRLWGSGWYSGSCLAGL